MMIFYYNPDHMSIIEFQHRNREKIHELTIQAIKKCIDSDLDKLSFMKIKPDNEVYVIRRPAFKDSLNKAKSYFESVEMYEKCSECVELLKLID